MRVMAAGPLVAVLGQAVCEVLAVGESDADGVEVSVWFGLIIRVSRMQFP